MCSLWTAVYVDYPYFAIFSVEIRFLAVKLVYIYFEKISVL